MPTYYYVRDAHKTRGPMDEASARLLLAEFGVAGREVAEVRSGAPGEKRVFEPAATHALWTERDASSPAPDAAPWLTTETSGWPDAERLGIVSADRDTSNSAYAASTRAVVLAELQRAAADLGADAVVAVRFEITHTPLPSPSGRFLISATGTALRIP